MRNISHGEQGMVSVKGRPYHGCPAEREFQSLFRFSVKGRQAKGWEAGKSWSLQLHIIGGSNPGLLFTVRLLIRPIVNLLPVDVEPNQILTNPKPVLIQSPRLVTTLSPVTEAQGNLVPDLFLKHTEPVDLLWSMMLKIFNILNVSQPELITSCWLYYNVRPPLL